MQKTSTIKPKDKFEILLESSPIGIYYSDFSGNFLYGNAKAEEIVGSSKENLLGKNFLKLKLLPPADLTKAAKLIALNRLGRNTEPVEFTLNRQDGNQRQVEISTRIIVIEGKKVIMGLVTDITERKKVEEELTLINQHNQLKADIWKMAADQTITDEMEFIQKLLDKIGPQLCVSRASYLPFNKDQECYTTKLQWCKKNIPSSLGETIGYDKAKHFFGRNYIEIPKDIDRLIKMPGLRKMIKAYATARLKKNGIKNYLVVTYGHRQDPEALFTFSECEIEKKWSDQEKTILSELVNIVSSKTEQIRAEAQISASLKEKVIMLQEIHHRVKNNMQVISSLLNLYSHKVKEEGTRHIFRECQSRIRSMALVHERLYQSKNMSKVDFAAYLDSLVTDLLRMYQVDLANIRFEKDLGKIDLDINQAVPCGLIINELVANCLKHAFPEKRNGTISLKMKQEEPDKVQIMVRDNGVGFPKNMDFRSTDSLGLTLVNELVRQINGEIHMEPHPGTSFTISF